jgi:hypothetical protein
MALTLHTSSGYTAFGVACTVELLLRFYSVANNQHQVYTRAACVARIKTRQGRDLAFIFMC